jgi:hypothetical protein
VLGLKQALLNRVDFFDAADKHTWGDHTVRAKWVEFHNTSSCFAEAE